MTMPRFAYSRARTTKDSAALLVMRDQMMLGRGCFRNSLYTAHATTGLQETCNVV